MKLSVEGRGEREAAAIVGSSRLLVFDFAHPVGLLRERERDERIFGSRGTRRYGVTRFTCLFGRKKKGKKRKRQQKNLLSKQLGQNYFNRILERQICFKASIKVVFCQSMN